MVIYVLEMEDVEVVFFGSWFHVFSAYPQGCEF